MSITVGITGITGKFARELVSALLRYPDIKIKGYCRDPSKPPTPLSSKVLLSQGDAFDTSAIRPFVAGCDVVVYCYLGDDKLMVDGQKALIDACAAEGVPRYLGELFPKDPMIHVKAYLDAQNKVKGVHVLVGMLMEVFFGPMFGTYDAASTTLKYWGSGNEVWEATTYRNAAEYTAAVCADKNASGVKRFLGGRATVREIAASFEEVYGVKPKLEGHGSMDDLFKKMHELRKNDPQHIFSYIFLFYQYYMINGRTHLGTENDNNQYPQVKPVGWEDFMKAVPEDRLANAYFNVGSGI
ncbi:nmrA-like family protein [Daldinia grandis]|nr:nmrA-like family protein [Daldinia grandis]